MKKVKKKDFHPDRVEFLVHIDPNDLTKNEKISIELFDEQGNLYWIEAKNKKIDLALIRLTDVWSEKWVTNILSKKDFPPKETIVQLGSDLIVIGCPLGFYDKKNNLPIARKASVASVYGIEFEDDPFFLIDSKLHEGTSGSPVLTMPSITIITTKGIQIYSSPKSFFLGINSSEFVQISNGKHENLQLNVIWYGFLLEHILSGKI